MAGKGLKLWIFALRDIKKGEELSYDYGFGFDENYKDFVCKCGSKNCCGYIVRRFQVENQKSQKISTASMKKYCLFVQEILFQTGFQEMYKIKKIYLFS